MQIKSAVRSLVILGVAAFITGPGAVAANADEAPAPVITSVYYGNYQSPLPSYQADVLYIDWANTPTAFRVYGSAGVATNNQVFFGNVSSVLRDGGNPRTRISYHAGVCAPECESGGIDQITWGPWYHPTIPATVTAAAPTLTATPGTKASPGVKITVNPGAQAGAPAFILYNAGNVVGRVGSDNLTFVDTAPYRPQNSYQVAACYADCNRPEWPNWGDGYKPTSARSAVVKVWTANTPSCQVLGSALFSLGLDWRSACKP